MPTVTVSSSSPGPSGGTGCQLGVGQRQAMAQGVEDQVELGVGDESSSVSEMTSGGARNSDVCSPLVAIAEEQVSLRAPCPGGLILEGGCYSPGVTRPVS